MGFVWLKTARSNAAAPLGVGDAGGEERGNQDEVENVSHERPPWRGVEAGRTAAGTATGLGFGVKIHLRYSRIWNSSDCDWVGTPPRRLPVEPAI